VAAINPFTSADPKVIEGYFLLLPESWKVPQRLTLSYSTDFEGFRRTTRHRQLFRLSSSGEWQPVEYPTAFLAEPRTIQVAYFDATAVDWGDVALDLVGIATAGVANYARTPQTIKTAQAIGNVAGTAQLTGHTYQWVMGEGDWVPVALDAFGFFPEPSVQIAAGVVSLALDLKPGFKFRQEYE